MREICDRNIILYNWWLFVIVEVVWCFGVVCVYVYRYGMEIVVKIWDGERIMWKKYNLFN